MEFWSQSDASLHRPINDTNNKYKIIFIHRISFKLCVLFFLKFKFW